MYYQMIVTVAILVDVSMLVWKLDMCDTSVPPGEEQFYAKALQFLGIDGWDRKA
jgi:hypothetical protein